MPKFPHNRRTRRAAGAAGAVLGAVGLVAVAAAPAAFAEEAAPELVVGGVGPVDGLEPGSSFAAPVTVANKGTAAAEKVWIYYAVTRGLDFAEVPSNCRTQQVRAYDEMPERWTMACEFDQVVEPGAVYTPETPLRVKALDRAYDDELRLRVGENDPGVDDNGTDPVAGTAPAVKLVERPGGDVGSTWVVDVPVASVNTADFQVTGAALTGSVGETVPMKVEFTNAGPAWVMARLDVPTVSVLVTPPAGTSVVKAGAFCKAKGESYKCGMGQSALHEDGGQTYAFRLRIDKKVTGAKGSVTLGGEARPADPDASNDKAVIALDVTGADPTASPSDPAGASGGSGGSSPVDGGGATPQGDTLAESGSSAPALTGVAAAAVATGAGTVVLVRRRTRNQG
ncbi:hypothetical protein ACIPSE_28305 [Streptomyces sp. NPDC090106]|uniref:hypothetical protein n=1 Tax=Streptomyces sp. NPDC090106 TaxID=3365946 RepID=UPI0037F89FE8